MTAGFGPELRSASITGHWPERSCLSHCTKTQISILESQFGEIVLSAFSDFSASTDQARQKRDLQPIGKSPTSRWLFRIQTTPATKQYSLALRTDNNLPARKTKKGEDPHKGVDFYQETQSASRSSSMQGRTSLRCQYTGFWGHVSSTRLGTFGRLCRVVCRDRSGDRPR